MDDDTSAMVIQRFYDEGIYPDWWKLEPLLTDAAWQLVIGAIERNDQFTGIVILGLGESEEKLAESFAGSRTLSSGKALLWGEPFLPKARPLGWQAS